MSASSSVWRWCDRRRNAGAPCRELARLAVRETIFGHCRGYEQRRGWLAIDVIRGTDLAPAMLEIMH